MHISINDVSQIKKLLAFLRVSASGDFKVSKEIIDVVFDEIGRFVKENDVTVEIITPSGEKVVTYATYGAFLGAAAGYVLASVPGAIAGALIGGAIGYGAAHITISIDISDDYALIALA